MCHRNDPKLLWCDLIDSAVGRPAQRKAASSAAKNCADQWVRQNKTGRSLEFGHESKPEFDIRFRRIKSRRFLQFGERERNNDELHFNAART